MFARTTNTEHPRITRIRSFGNAIKHHVYDEYWDRSVSRVEEEALDTILREYDDETVFVHAGLSDVNSAFDGDPYELLMAKLTESFENILAPGYTPSFRTTGLYHKLYSKPEVGMFSRLFLEDADYRTDDPIHSILVRGDYRFDECNHRQSFGAESCWAKLDDDDVLWMNIGTDTLVCTLLHHLEHRYDVPYNTVVENDGVIYYDEHDHEEIVQKNYTYDFTALRNDMKIRRMLQDAGALDFYNLGGLKVMLMRARDVHRAVKERLEDPYYLIT